MTTRDELRSGLAFRYEQFRDSLESDDPAVTFNEARSLDADGYAAIIVTRVRQAGPLRAACEDVADAVGAVDEDEAVWGVHVVARQWHHVADALEPTDALAVRVRMAAQELIWRLEQDDFDLEMLSDVVSIAALEAEWADLAVVWIEAVERKAEESFWVEHEARAGEAFRLLAGMKMDLRSRGELALDDELLPPDLAE